MENVPDEEIEEPRSYLHNYPSFSFLLSAISCLVSMFLSLDWRAADHVFIVSFQRKQLVPHGHNYGKKKRSCTTLLIIETNC